MQTANRCCFQKLRHHGLDYSMGDDMLVWYALSVSHSKLPQFIWALPIQRDFCHPATGKSFLHLIVDKLATDGRYNRSEAEGDAKKFIGVRGDWGVWVSHRDDQGLTALDRLQTLSTRYPSVERLLKKKAEQQSASQE